MDSDIDPPPIEPVSRVSVVRQLEDDDEEDNGSDGALTRGVDSVHITDRERAIPASTKRTASISQSTPSQPSHEIQPNDADMGGMPGEDDDEHAEGIAESHSVDNSPSPPAADGNETESNPTPRLATPSKSSNETHAADHRKQTTAKKNTAAATTASTTKTTKPSSSSSSSSKISTSTKAKSSAVKQSTPRDRPTKANDPSTDRPPSSSTSVRPASASRPPSATRPPTSGAASTSSQTATTTSDSPAQIHAIVVDGKKRASGMLSKASKEKDTEVKEEAPIAVAAAKKPAAAKKSTTATTKSSSVTSPQGKIASKSQPTPPPPVTDSAEIDTTPSPTAASSSLADEFDFSSHETISRLTDDNRQLRSDLESRVAENGALADALLTLQAELEASEKGSGAILAKELARKNRDLNVQLTKERALHLQQVDALKKQHAAELDEARTSQGTKLPSPTKKTTFGFGTTLSNSQQDQHQQQPTHTIESLEAKLAHVQKQYLDKSNELSLLQSKQKQLVRVLIKEIDENLKPDEVLDEKFLGKQKGRAQKITRLQDRVRDLEKQLANGASSSASASSSVGGVNPSSNSLERSETPLSQAQSQSQALIDFHENTLAKMAAGKKQDLAQLKEIIETKDKEIEDLKGKYVSIKARAKNVSRERT